jgi:hypothetical protein
MRDTTGTSGQALLLMTISLIFMFSVVGLSVDLGWAFYLKSRVQTSADAAATAAVVYATNNGDTCSNVTCGVSYTCAGVTPPTNSLQSGCLYATTDGPPAVTVTMLENDTAIGGSSPQIWVKATVSTTAHNLFLYGAGYQTANIAASATAGITTTPAGGCVYVLSPTASSAFYLTGSAVVTVTSCGLRINSNSSTSLVNDSSTIRALGGGTIRLNGGYSNSGTISPAPVSGAGTVTDPLASLTMPSVANHCDHTNYSLGSTSATISPGVYCGGIRTSSSHLTLNPGIYILNGTNGGKSLSIDSSTVTAPGVVFFITGQNGYTAGPISVTGSSILNMSAPTTGTYRGILFLQDRSTTYAGSNVFDGSSGGTTSGTFYFPTTKLTITGTSSTSTKMAYVANTLEVDGSSSLTSDSTGSLTGLARAAAALIQ